MFTWAMREGLVDANPVIATNRAIDERSRDRVLSDAELVDIWNACREDDYGRIVRLLILTGQRRGEVGGMRWSEISKGERLWSLPAVRTKNRCPHDVPLSDATLAIPSEQTEREGREYVFGDGEGAFSGWSLAKAALDKRILEARQEKAGKGRGKAIVPDND